MELKQGNMWTVLGNPGFFIFTGNVVVKGNGALVMGRGIAREIRDAVPGVDKVIGDAVKLHIQSDFFYGVILMNPFSIFQVKYSYSDPADLDLIQRSSVMLGGYALRTPNIIFNLNFPGIGNGKLKYNDVLPLLESLPDNVHVWTFK